MVMNVKFNYIKKGTADDRWSRKEITVTLAGSDEIILKLIPEMTEVFAKEKWEKD